MCVYEVLLISALSNIIRYFTQLCFRFISIYGMQNDRRQRFFPQLTNRVALCLDKINEGNSISCDNTY